METNPLFPLKYRLRKTDEQVEVIASETAERGARSESDWVSYIDASGVEHVKERLTLEWDFIIESPFEKGFGSSILSDTLKAFDQWEQRRYDIVRQMVVEKGCGVAEAVKQADEIIEVLKPKNGLE